VYNFIPQKKVTGWGYDETGQITEELKMGKMPIVSQQVCLWSNSDFYPHFTSDKTYCAGFRNGMCTVKNLMEALGCISIS
jgi:hypothetical protein